MTPLRLTLNDGRAIEIVLTQAADAPALVAYANRAGGESTFLPFGRDEFDLSVDEEAAVIRALDERDLGFVLKGVIDAEIAGSVSLRWSARPRIRHVADLSISVAKAYWGLGAGRRLCEASIALARERGVRKIDLKVRADNLRAIRLYESLGFRHEGVSERAYLVDGRFFADKRMGLLID